MAKRVWATGLVLVAAMLACSPIQRHSVLDFVFDGVPPYLTPEERAHLAREAAQRRTELEAEGPRRSRQPIKKLGRFTHGPFAVDECTRCHDLTTTSGFRGLRSGAGGGRAGADLAEAGRLRMPVDELCINCHTDFTSEAPNNDGLWLHGPVASGWCVLCHQPHSALFPALLVLDPPARLCTRCHELDDLVETVEHRPLQVEDGFPDPPTVDPEMGEPVPRVSIVQVVRDCTRCHDPHRGPDRLILRPRHQWEGPHEPHARMADLDASREDP